VAKSNTRPSFQKPGRVWLRLGTVRHAGGPRDLRPPGGHSLALSHAAGLAGVRLRYNPDRPSYGWAHAGRGHVRPNRGEDGPEKNRPAPPLASRGSGGARPNPAGSEERRSGEKPSSVSLNPSRVNPAWLNQEGSFSSRTGGPADRVISPLSPHNPAGLNQGGSDPLRICARPCDT